jgi:hypothetical protein
MADGRRVVASQRGAVLALLLLIAGGVLLQCWQLRGSALANLYAGIACAAWAAAIGARIRQTQPLPLRLLRRAGPVLLVGLLPISAGLLVDSLSTSQQARADRAQVNSTEREGDIHGDGDGNGYGYGDGDIPGDRDCDLRAIAERLNQPDLLASGPLLIAAPINLGAPLLWLTPHQVLSAPYHRNTQGIEDAQRLFFTDEATARTIVEQRGIDLILICPHDPVATHELREGIRLFYDQLRAGQTPDWLIELPLAGKARLLMPVTLDLKKRAHIQQSRSHVSKVTTRQMRSS